MMGWGLKTEICSDSVGVMKCLSGASESRKAANHQELKKRKEKKKKKKKFQLEKLEGKRYEEKYRTT